MNCGFVSDGVLELDGLMENDLLSAKLPYVKASHVGILRLVTPRQRRYPRSKGISTSSLLSLDIDRSSPEM